MKIDSINFNIKINNLIKTKRENKELQSNLLPVAQNRNCYPKNYYISFGGEKKKHPKVIQDILDDTTKSEMPKKVLQQLLKIKNFEEVASHMDERTMMMLLALTATISPVVEGLLSGDYVFTDENNTIEKPIIDLKSIIEYNKKHPQTPINLYDEIMDNPLAAKITAYMTSTQKRSLENPVEIREEQDGIILSSIVKQKSKTPTNFIRQSKTISKKEYQELKQKPVSEAMMEVFRSEKINPEAKEILWRLSEIPFFNALTEDFSQKDLCLFANTVIQKTPFFMEALEGNIVIRDLKTGKEKPLIDLEDIAIRNRLNPKRGIAFLDSISQNDVFLNSLKAATFYKKRQNKYPILLLSRIQEPEVFDAVLNKQDLPYDQETLLKKLSSKYQYAVIFKNNLNKITEKPTATQRKSLESEKTKHTNTKPFPTPAALIEYLKDPSIYVKNKQAAYELGENPYFNAIAQDISRQNIKNLVWLKRQFPIIFDKTMEGKTEIEILTPAGKKSYSIIKPELLANYKRNLSTTFDKGLLSYDLCEELGKIYKGTRQNLAEVGYKLLQNDDVECLIKLKSGAMALTQIPKNILADSVQELLDSIPDKQFTLRIKD